MSLHTKMTPNWRHLKRRLGSKVSHLKLSPFRERRGWRWRRCINGGAWQRGRLRKGLGSKAGGTDRVAQGQMYHGQQSWRQTHSSQIFERKKRAWALTRGTLSWRQRLVCPAKGYRTSQTSLIIISISSQSSISSRRRHCGTRGNLPWSRWHMLYVGDWIWNLVLDWS